MAILNMKVGLDFSNWGSGGILAWLVGEGWWPKFGMDYPVAFAFGQDKDMEN